VLQLIKSKCVPVLLYGLEACALNKSQMASLDFVVHRFFMKLFNTNNINTVKAVKSLSRLNYYYYYNEIVHVVGLQQNSKKEEKKKLIA